MAAIAYVTEDQANKLANQQEGHFLDYKRKEISPSKLTKTLSAFANADGGELIIGIDDDTREWRGFATIEEANAHVAVFEQVSPFGQDITYEFLSCTEKTGFVLQVNIKKSGAIRKTTDDKIYIRRSAQNLPVDSDEALQNLKRAKGISSFETETVSAPLIDICNSTTILSFLIDVIPTAEPEAWLKKQSLIVSANPTVAGFLLFSDEPQTKLPKACIKIYRYKTNELEGSRDQLVGDPESIEGPIYAQISKAVARTAEIIEEIKVVREGGITAIQYPRETLHEIITNAVLHRDYAFVDNTHVRIFDNRVEIESPGRLPAHVTVSNILQERFSRNGTIVRLINKFPNPPNKDVGEGLNTAFDAMRKLNLKDPIIEERNNSVLVLIRHEQLASADNQILMHLQRYGTINNATARQITGEKSEIQMRRVFQRLTKAKEIEKTPGTNRGSTTYQLRIKK